MRVGVLNVFCNNGYTFQPLPYYYLLKYLLIVVVQLLARRDPQHGVGERRLVCRVDQLNNFLGGRLVRQKNNLEKWLA